MIIGRFFFFFVLLLLQFQFQLQILIHASHSPPPLNPSPSDPNATYILQDVLKAISVKQNWDFNDVRVSKFDVAMVRFGTSQRYEFRIGLGRNHLLFKLLDQVGSWNKFRKPKSDLGSLIRRVSSLAVLDTFKLEGPFELRVDDHHQLSLSLPTNISYNGLKHILVGEGITLEVKGAQEVSLIHSSDLDLQINRSTAFSKGKSDVWPFMQSMCMPLFPIRILGPASVVAYRARNPDLHIETTFISGDMIELLPEKCYGDHMYRKQACPINSFSLRLNMLEKILRSLMRHRILENQLFGVVKASVKSSSAVKFPMELERVVGSNVTDSVFPEWRTRPSVERVRFQISARVEEDRLKPLFIKKLKPFIESDSFSWGNLMSNMSFTKLRSVLVAPEALTLDVKW